MEKLTIILDWIGAFFLSVEAMKLKNFTLIIKKLRVALNPHFYYQEDGSVLIPKPAKEFKANRRWSLIIQVAFGYFIIFLIIGLISQSDFVIHFVKNFYGSLFSEKLLLIIGKLVLGAIVFFLIPLYIGLVVTRIFSNLSDSYENILGKLEEYTFAGIIGLIGFGLLSISFIIKLLK